MKSVRLKFSKKGRLKFISHLDLNRLLIRTVRMAKIPIWYTEGFHPHPYLNIALPLSLGHTGENEILDIKILDDNMSEEKIVNALNSVCPLDLEFLCAYEPNNKTANIGFAEYEISFADGGEVYDSLSEFLKRDEIICNKKTKKGDIKQINIAPDIKSSKLDTGQNTTLYLTLPAGSEKNINPELLITAFYEQYSQNYYCYSVNRTAILDKNGDIFE